MNVLFIGNHHEANDPRLAYRQMMVLKNDIRDIEFYFLVFRPYPQNISTIEQKIVPNQIYPKKRSVCGFEITELTIYVRTTKLKKLVGYLFKSRSMAISNIVKSYFGNTEIAVVQASDVRELALAVKLSEVVGCRTIYDSHEDYVRQALDYGRSILKPIINAATYFFAELRFVRAFDHIFCTDTFLEKKYKKRIYGAKEVGLLRNFPVLLEGTVHQPEYVEKEHLKLVYIGGVNPYRGVVEAAEYIERFNASHTGRSLSFTIYSTPSQITTDLQKKYGTELIPAIEYEQLINQLPDYDVGMCLLHPIKKYYRNLPVKNFDYMSVGLPIVTSNFGNLKIYMDESDAGLCIDPLSYDAFAEAINKMFDRSFREHCGNNGVKWVRDRGNFQQESISYREFFKLFQADKNIAN